MLPCWAEINGCEDVIDEFAGAVFTLINSKLRFDVG